VLFRSDYNVFGPAPTTVVATGAVFNRFVEQGGPDTFVTLGGDLVNGRTVSFTAIEGNVSGGGLSTQVPVRPANAPVQTVTVTDDGSPITITVPTELPAEKWEALLADEMGPGGHVTDVRDGPGESVVVELEQGVSYDLRIGRAVVGTGNATAEPTYLTVDGGATFDVAEGGSRTFTVQVRDRYNNPVSGVTVDASAEHGSVTAVEDDVTDAAGRVTFRYEYASNIDGQASVSDQVNVSFDSVPVAGAPFDGSSPENATVQLTVHNTDRSGIEEAQPLPLNPTNESGELVILRSTIDGQGCDDGTSCVSMHFHNPLSAEQRIIRARYVFYSPSSQGRSGWSPPTDATLRNATLERGGDYQSITAFSVSGSDSGHLTIDFGEEVVEGDFYVLSVLIDTDGDRVPNRYATYFVAPRSDGNSNNNGKGKGPK
jgi:hypothetical protein